MPLIYAGIDEAGYGPLLGPLCVGMSVFRVEEWAEGEQAPDMWKLLSSAVCRNAADKRRRIAVDDSKKLKLANSTVGKHPLTHLERGVLTFLQMIESGAVAADADVQPASSPCGCPKLDAEFFDRIGAAIPGEPWYAGEPSPWPVGTSADMIGIGANTLRIAMARAGVRVLELKCQAMGESTFNELVQAAGTKAAATEAALVEHLWRIWEQWGAIGGSGGGVRVICDRQGGRSYYAEMLGRAFPGVEVEETHHSETQSRYEMRGIGDDGLSRHMHVLFLVESERQHLPVALASMLAKLTRESMMARFNRYWCSRLPELKPTAGYRGDGWRWLEDVKSVVSASERSAMIRRA